MLKDSKDLHKNAPDSSHYVVLIIDMINDFAWPKGDKVLPYAHEAAQAIRKLKAKAKKAKVPCIYVNDNFGQWHSNFAKQIEHCKKRKAPVAEISELLSPSPKDYLVLKPKHSAFYASPLEILLKHMDAKHLIITGLTTESCVMITAMDAFIRGYKLSVPQDCVASSDPEKRDLALQQMESSFEVDISPSTSLTLSKGTRH